MGSGPPRQLRLSIVGWWVVALLLLLQTAVMWAGRDALPDQVAGSGLAPLGEAAGHARHLLAVNTAFGIGLAAAYLVLGALLFRRRPWARLLLTGFAVVHLLMLLGTGAVLSVNGVLVLFGAVAGLLLWWPTSTEWVTGEHD
ncbi:hypothetical protein [Saccharopolyspora sp. CA-218241]|uniref:hypothetical protein n=1 Tax=Saccharopolyspora sp. CA-218241 TaxID=3240027 RepID=UPI003D98B651